MSLRATFRGKRILVTGASGFLGKVWLAQVLERLPEVERLTLLLRPGKHGARARLVDLLETSPAFWGLHERHPDGLEPLLGALDPIPGDVTEPLCGLDPEQVDALRGELDLVLHVAGLTDMAPRLELALAINVDGTLNALELARATGARLVHVSTAYVAGRRRGVVPETVEPNYAPDGERTLAFDAERELADLRKLLARKQDEVNDQQVVDQLTAENQARGRVGKTALRRAQQAWLKEHAAAAALERAQHWGWPNVYVYTKSLAESLLLRERGDVPVTIVRPAVVESALHEPFPGWKEGLHTCGPLVWAVDRGHLRGLLAREDVVLDVIPVDWVARGMTLACAAALDGRHDEQPVAYHLGTSAQNPIPMWRVIELCALGRRQSEGPPAGRDLLQADAVACGSDALYERTSIPLLKRLARHGQGLLRAAAERLPVKADAARRLASQVKTAETQLGLLEDFGEMFRFFVKENEAVYGSERVAAHTAALDAEEQHLFGYDVTTLDWRRYWLDVHMPGLRRWVYPKIEGGRAEACPRREVRLPIPAPTPAPSPAR